MKRHFNWLMVLLIAIISIQPVDAQDEEERPNPLIFSIGAKFVLQGFEMGFEHRISKKFSLRTSLGFDNRYAGDKTYNNRELIISMPGNSRSFPYGMGIGPYLKIKDSYYSYSPPDENFMLDAYSSFYFFGAGIAAEYRQKIGNRFIVSPYARAGVNKVILRRDDGPGINPFTNNTEADFNLGLALSFIF